MRDTTASLLGTSRCTYAIEPPYREPYVRWCERTGLFSPSYSIESKNRNRLRFAAIPIFYLWDIHFELADAVAFLILKDFLWQLFLFPAEGGASVIGIHR